MFSKPKFFKIKSENTQINLGVKNSFFVAHTLELYSLSTSDMTMRTMTQMQSLVGVEMFNNERMEDIYCKKCTRSTISTDEKNNQFSVNTAVKINW